MHETKRSRSSETGVGCVSHWAGVAGVARRLGDRHRHQRWQRTVLGTLVESERLYVLYFILLRLFLILAVWIGTPNLHRTEMVVCDRDCLGWWM